MIYQLKHIGLNCDNAEEAEKTAKQLAMLFGMQMIDGESASYCGDIIECMKNPSRGKNGHIAIYTNDIHTAIEDLSAKGIGFDDSSRKYTPDGSLKIIYLSDEFCGFAIHLTSV